MWWKEYGVEWGYSGKSGGKGRMEDVVGNVGERVWGRMGQPGDVRGNVRGNVWGRMGM